MEILKEMKMLEKIKNLEPGSSLVYYTSTLAPISKAGTMDIVNLRNEVYKMHLRDEVELVQRRTDFAGVFDYIVIKKRNPPKRANIERRIEYNRFIAANKLKKHGDNK